MAGLLTSEDIVVAQSERTELFGRHHPELKRPQLTDPSTNLTLSTFSGTRTEKVLRVGHATDVTQ